MRQDQPHVAAWVERFTGGGYRDDARAKGDWIDPAKLGELYRRIEATYFPWVTGNRKAVAAGEKTFAFSATISRSTSRRRLPREMLRRRGSPPRQARGGGSLGDRRVDIVARVQTRVEGAEAAELWQLMRGLFRRTSLARRADRPTTLPEVVTVYIEIVPTDTVKSSSTKKAAS